MKIRLAALSSLAFAATQFMLLFAIAPIGRGQSIDLVDPSPDQPGAVNAAAEANPNQSPEPTGGGQLQPVVVTGYLIARVGVGPQPVTT